MKFVTAMYVIMTLLLVVNLLNSTFFSGAYDGIAAWLCTGLFIVGTAFFINAKQKLSDK